MKKVAIIGGGIGGLCLAVALQRQNFEAHIYENAPEIRPLGAGLVLASNAMKALGQIQIAEKVCELGMVLEKFSVLDEAGDTITETNQRTVRDTWGNGSVAIHRVDLHHLLAEQLRPNTLHLNKKYLDFDKDGEGFRVKFADGSSTVADAIIGADGIHSPLRQKMIPNSKKRYAGYTCWRAVIQMPDGFSTSSEATETWGKKGRFGIVPIGKNRIYWFACVNAPNNDPTMKSMKKQDLLEIFKDFHEPIPQILAHSQDEDLLWNDIIDLAPIKQFAFGNVVLMGDAAHATTPNMGQGACQAIEDAIVLANCMRQETDFAKAFKLFEGKRIKRVTKIVNTSWQIGRIAQMENQLLIKLRNTLLRMIPQSINNKQLEFLYEIDFQ